MSTRKITIEYINGDKPDCVTFTVNSYEIVHTSVDSSGYFRVTVGDKLVFICTKLIAFSDQATDDE